MKKIIPILLLASLCFKDARLQAQTIRYAHPALPWYNWGDGSSWGSLGDLSVMIWYSQPGDLVYVVAGSYPVTGPISMKEGVKIYGGFTGSETSHLDRDLSVNSTTLWADDGHGTIIYNPDGSNLTAASVLDGFTLTGASDTLGGGMYNYRNSPTISNCIFLGNSATQKGGGMYNFRCSPTIINCTFSGNLGNQVGGGMYNYGSSPVITNSTFSGNNSYQGGAMFNEGGQAVVINCTFINNRANDNGVLENGRGAGIYNNEGADLSIFNCSFTNNVAVRAGGGIYNFRSGPTINTCVFSGNNAGEGGGIFNNDNALALTIIRNCDFRGNTAIWGAGLRNYRSSPAINNCLFRGNSAQNGGAGVDNYIQSHPAVNNCSFTGNKAPSGAAINNNESSPAITNCTIAGNNTNVYSAIYNWLSEPVIRNCIIWGNQHAITHVSSTTTYANVQYSIVQGGYTGTGNLNIDPQFESAPAHAGAPFVTGSYNLRICSPAINAGGNAFIASGITTDVVGSPRIYGATVDLGAFEYAKQSSAANILYVNANNIEGGRSGNSWANAVTSLDEALLFVKQNESNWTAANPLKIFVANGIYEPGVRTCATPNDRTYTFSMISHVQLYGGFDPANGVVSLNDTRNFTAGGSVLDGDIGAAGNTTDNCYHVVTFPAGVSYVVLDGFTITKGNASGSGTDAFAGGVLLQNSSATIANCTISNNTGYFGAGMMNSSSTSVVVSNCTFSNNVASSFGGGVYNSAASPTYTNCSFSGNVTINGTAGGAGMFNNASSPILTNCNFTSNTGDYGGGIYNYGASSPIITGCTFSLNTGSTFGGGIYNETPAAPLIQNSIFSGNNSQFGGAMMNYGAAVVKNSFFSGNTAASYGGGVYNLTSPVRYDNCLFSGNATINGTGGGGGMFNNSTTTTVTNCTFTGNTGDFGGAIRNWGTSTATVRNSVIWGNSSAIHNESAASASVQYTLVQGGYAGTGNMNTNPMFVNAASPAGADGTWNTLDDGLRVQNCSPAINAGSNALVNAGVTTDINGHPRLQFSTVDLGAYEANSLASITSANIVASNVAANAWQLSNGQTVYAMNCNTLVAAVTGDGTANALSGNTTVKTWIETVASKDFVKRHYEITPLDMPAATATGIVTLYFTQAEFDAFNALNTIKLPQNPSDVAGKANLLIEKRAGVSNNNSGLPESYAGARTTIDPDDANIVWNVTALRWEISFAVNGFSGFFVKTNFATLPLRLIRFTAEENNCVVKLQWTTADETRVSHFEAEQSTDGISFNSFTTVPAKNISGENKYAVTVPVADNQVYYRLKMVDIDGTVTYSQLNVLNAQCGGKLQVYPNPATERIYIRNGVIGSYYRIYDNGGRMVLGGKINKFLQDIYVGRLKRGIYYVVINGQYGFSLERKFIKK